MSEVLAPVQGGVVQGIKGSFAGTLYNEANPMDSLIISRGAFTLKKVNWYNFDQRPVTLRGLTGFTVRLIQMLVFKNLGIYFVDRADAGAWNDYWSQHST